MLLARQIFRMSLVSNGLYFLPLPLVGILACDLYIKRNVEKVWGTLYTLGVCYLYIKRNVEKVWGARYTLGARYLPKNTVVKITHLKE
jgi:hypothetical protein